MLHGGGLEKASPARTIETHSPPGIEKTLNIMLRERTFGAAYAHFRLGVADLNVAFANIMLS